MTIGLYFLSLILTVLAINIWSKEDDAASVDARLQKLLNISAAGSGPVALVVFGWGFFLFSWYIPVSAMLVSLFTGTAGAMLARRGENAAGVGVASGFASVAVAIALLYVSQQG